MKLLGILFPPKCVFCASLLGAKDEYICAKCMDSIKLAGERPRKGEFFAAAVGALSYEGEVRRALHRFKYNGRQNYARPLALTLDFAVRQKLGRPFGLIVAVPTTRKNLRRRGYNHAALLARELSALCGVPFIDALEKSRETKPMFGLNLSQRRANVLGSIRVARGQTEIAGKGVLVVDDIITTGSTVSECARMLLECGAREVYGAAVATGESNKERVQSR